MDHRGRTNVFAALRAASNARSWMARWLGFVVVAWLSATLLLTGPGVALLVAAAHCESDAPEESERGAVDESCLASQLRRAPLRQLVVRSALIVRTTSQLEPQARVSESLRGGAHLVPQDSRLGAGIPLRC